LIADIYGAREAREITDRVSATDLVEAIRGQGGRSDLGGQVHELPDRLTELHEQDDLLLVLGAGDIGGVVEDVVARL
jgi:UDP-N-acetylmuramate-alanine ligase